MKYLIYAIFMMTLLAGCGGTGTGNPGLASPSLTTSPADGAASELLLRVCSKISSCGLVSYGLCASGMKAATNIDTEVGLSVGRYATFNDIIVADNSSRFLTYPSARDYCLNSVSTLACTDAKVQGAYAPSSSTPFNGIASMVAPYCYNFLIE